VDFVELRGEIRPMRSVVLTAPMQAGELQIVRLAKNGSAVKPGDIVVEFDGTTLKRTQQEKLSELRQAEAEIDQGRAQARLIEEQNRTALMKARFDVDRAALEFREGDRAWAGAGIVELPDVSAVHLAARLEEAGGGRVAIGQTALVRADAVPDREYHAKRGVSSATDRPRSTSGP
jgi:multidrug efflux pump subunit AcrA (membrane-fusion protein)